MRIYGITKKQAEEITAKDKYEMDKFWNKHCAQAKDPLTLIVKCHLFIESCMAELLTLYLPNSEKILEKKSPGQIVYIKLVYDKTKERIRYSL